MVATEQRKQELVQQVAASARFQRSPRLREFFLLICQHALAGNTVPLHEQEIGRRVYERREDYNPADDNIVRVEARRLRRELDAYFNEEGAAEPVVIGMPKGSYMPAFTARAMAQPAVEAARPAAPHRRTWLVPVLAGGGLVLLALVFLWFHSRPRESAAIWPGLLDPARRTNIVLADASLSLLQDLTGAEVPLDEYASRRYVAELKGREQELIAGRPLVGLASVLIATRILQSEACPRANVAVRHAHDLSARDFQSDQHILLGSRHSNPWVELFAERRNFQARPEWLAGAAGYLNRRPAAGEPAVYEAGPQAQYGVIAYVPNLSRSGAVLLIEGTSQSATEAAWTFLADGVAFPRFLDQHGLRRNRREVAWFELLVKTSAAGGAPTRAEYVAHRRVS